MNGDAFDFVFHLNHLYAQPFQLINKLSAIPLKNTIDNSVHAVAVYKFH